MPKFDANKASTVHKSLVNSSKEVKEAFCYAANLASDKGMNITSSIKLGLQAAKEQQAKEELVKQKELQEQQGVNKAEVALKESLEKQQKAKEQQHLQALKTALEALDEQDDTEVLLHVENVSKAVLEQSRSIVSTYFDQQGRLVTVFDDASKLVSKNSAPADNIQQSVAVQVNPVFDYLQMQVNAFVPAEDRQPGMLTWNKFEDCLDIVQADGSTLQAGLETYIQVKNNSGTSLPNGAVVMFAGVDLEEIPTVLPIAATANQEPLYIVGVLTNALENQEVGRATILGKVRNLDTTGSSSGETWQQGDLLWVHPSQAGKLTRIRPTAPSPAISVAAVLKVSATQGILLVRPTIFPRLFYGKFKSNAVQQPLAADTPYAVNFETTEISAGVVIQDNSKVKCLASGLYSFDFRLQVTSTNSSQKVIYIWYRINGTDVPNTTTKVSLAGNAFEVIPSWNFVHTMQAGDYFQLMYACSDTSVLINAPSSTSFCPATPSAVLKVNQINL